MTTLGRVQSETAFIGFNAAILSQLAPNPHLLRHHIISDCICGTYATSYDIPKARPAVIFIIDIKTLLLL